MLSEQDCIETWNVRSMNQGKSKVVKLEIARVNINILVMSELSGQQCAVLCLVTQSCPNPRDPMDCSLPGSSIHRIFQTRVLELCAITFSEGLNLKLSKSKAVNQTRSLKFLLFQDSFTSLNYFEIQ